MELDLNKEHYEFIESSDELIVKEYNQLILKCKQFISEITYLNDVIKRDALDYKNLKERNEKLENDFDEVIEKELNKRYGVLKSQVSILKKNAEKHIADKNELKEKIKIKDKNFERINAERKNLKRILELYGYNYDSELKKIKESAKVAEK